MTRKIPQIVAVLLASTAITLVALPGCKKDPPPAPIEIPPAPVVEAGVVPIAPLDDTPDAAPEAAPPKPHGTYTPTNANAARVRQCCNAIRKEAKSLGNAPEANLLNGVALQCDLVASQIGGGAAPEFAQVRAMLKGRTIPAACSGM